MLSVRQISTGDLEAVVRIHRECFPDDGRGTKASRAWILANARAYPINSYFVLLGEGVIIGYILWAEKGGFRKEAVLELAQIGVTASSRGQGGGEFLINESFKEVQLRLDDKDRRVELVLVTTSTSNEAQRLYEHAVELFRETGLKVATGHFQEYMQVRLQNDGPVTILLDSDDRHRSRRG